jgi:hypothetical protein
MANRFGWTPTQVDEIPAETADWILAIATTVEQVKNEKAEQARK